MEGIANPAPHHVAFGSTIDLALTSTDGATSIVWEIMGCSEPTEAIPVITPAGSPSGATASFVFPADSADTLGRTFLVRCTVSNQVRGADGAYQQDIQYAVIGAENSQGELPIVPGEKNYRHGTHGWAPEINRALNNSGGGGGGGSGGGWTDDGAVVRLTSSSDSVAIGTASLVGSEKLRVIGSSRFEQAVATTGAPKAFYVSGGAHTTLSAGGEIVDVDFALDRTVQHATGAVTTQRALVVRAPTYSFVGASTVTDAATLAITAAPVAGTNATLTNSYALWVQAGAVRLQALTVGVVVASATGVLSSVTGTALQVLRWNSGGTALEFANPGSSLSAPSNPGDDGKAAVASGGNLTYTLLSNAHIASGAAITLTKLATIATDRLLGRDTAGTGAIEELTVSGGVEFTTAGGIQRSALTGDVTAAAGSNTTAIAAGVIVDADVNASAAIAFTKLATIATDRLLGRDTAGTGALEAITVGGGLEFGGSTNIQRSALTGDVTAAAGSSVTSIGTGVIVDSDISGSAGITLTKLANIATDRLLGRDTASSGTVEEISVTGGLEFSGSTSIQRSAISGDITIAAGSGTAAITAGVIVDADVNASAAIVLTKLANGSACSVVGRSVNSSGAHGDIASTADGEVFRRAGGVVGWGTIEMSSVSGTLPISQLTAITALSVVSNATNASAIPTAVASSADFQIFRRLGTALGWGSVDLSQSAAVGTSRLQFGNMPDVAALTVLGRAGPTAGVMSGITGATDQVFRVDSAGTALGFGTVATGGIANNAVTLAKLATQAALTVLANATNGIAVPTAVAAGVDAHVFQRSGTTLVFAALSTASITDAAVTYAKIQNVTTDRLLGRDTAGTGVVEELTVTGGVEFTGTGIQRSALTGDVTASAGSGVTAIAAGVIVDADVNASAAIAFTKLATIATDRLLGRDTAGTGALEAISLGVSLEFSGSTSIQRAALTGDVTAAANSNTTAIAAGVIVDADINSSASITITKLAPSGTNGRVMVTVGGVATWGTSIGNTTDVFTLLSNDVTVGNGSDTWITLNSASDVFNVGTAGALRLQIGSVANFQATNIVTTGNLLLGADPADTGRIRLSNGDAIYWEASPAGGDVLGLAVDGLEQLTLGNAASVGYLQSIADGSHVWITGGSTQMSLSTTVLETAVGVIRWRFANGVVNPVIHVQSSSVPGPVTGTSLELAGQDMAGAGTTVVGGILYARAGNSTNGTGGALNLYSGSGPIANGAVNLHTGTTLRLNVPSTGDFNFQNNALVTTGNLLLGSDPADTGRIRLTNGDAIYWEANPAGTDVLSITVNSVNSLVLGNTSTVAYALQPSTSIHAWLVGGVTELQLSSTAFAIGSDATMNLALFDPAFSFNSGLGVIGIRNANTIPTSAPSSGGYIYLSGDAAVYLSADGTYTTFGVA